MQTAQSLCHVAGDGEAASGSVHVALVAHGNLGHLLGAVGDLDGYIPHVGLSLERSGVVRLIPGNVDHIHEGEVIGAKRRNERGGRE